MTDINLTAAKGWTLTACNDGERWTLHVSHTDGRSASLAAAVDANEVMTKGGEFEPLRDSEWRLFDDWHDSYDAFIAEAEDSHDASDDDDQDRDHDDGLTSRQRETNDRLDMGRNDAGEWLGFM